MVVPAMERAVSDFQFIDPIQPTKVSGLPSAFMRATYKMANQQGRMFHVRTRIILVPRGAYMFMISMSCKADDPDNSEAILVSALQTIKIEP